MGRDMAVAVTDRILALHEEGTHLFVPERSSDISKLTHPRQIVCLRLQDRKGSEGPPEDMGCGGR